MAAFLVNLCGCSSSGVVGGRSLSLSLYVQRVPVGYQSHSKVQGNELLLSMQKCSDELRLKHNSVRRPCKLHAATQEHFSL